MSGKYCKNIDELHGSSCFVEFYPGDYKGKKFTNKQSIFVDDDTMIWFDEGLELSIKKVVPNYDPFSDTTVTKSEWQEIGIYVQEYPVKAQELYHELDEWVQNTIPDDSFFTIIGV